MTTRAEKIKALATAIGNDIKSINLGIGDLTTLSTNAKTNIVLALNEINQIARDAQSAANSATGIDDSQASSSTTWSSNKINTEISNVKTSIGDTSLLSTIGGTTSTDLIKALQYLNTEIKNAKDSLGAKINDATNSSTTETWSANKIYSSINTAVAQLIDNSPSALDTLKELADALGNDANFSTTIANQMGVRVRVDAAQAFTAEQQLQGCNNLGLGDPTTDFVAVYNIAKV